MEGRRRHHGSGVEGARVEKRSVDGYVYVGTAIRYLVDCQEGYGVFTPGGVVDNIESLNRKLMVYELFVTVRVLGRLSDTVREWREEAAAHEDEEAWEESRALTGDEADKVRAAANTGRETLLAEASGKVAYIAEDKRYTVEKLTDQIETLFAVGVFDELPTIAQEDFTASGRAIAFMLPTAAAFHILRGTEAALRGYYARLVLRGRIAEPRMWAAIVADLRAKSTPPPDLLTTSLDSLRKHYRNPTQHPDKSYDIDEVQDLLASAIDVVNQMHRHLTQCGR